MDEEAAGLSGSKSILQTEQARTEHPEHRLEQRRRETGEDERRDPFQTPAREQPVTCRSDRSSPPGEDIATSEWQLGEVGISDAAVPAPPYENHTDNIAAQSPHEDRISNVPAPAPAGSANRGRSLKRKPVPPLLDE